MRICVMAIANNATFHHNLEYIHLTRGDSKMLMNVIYPSDGNVYY